MPDNQHILELIHNQSHAADVVNELTAAHGLTLTASPASKTQQPATKPSVRQLVGRELNRTLKEMCGDGSARPSELEPVWFITSHREQIVNLILDQHPTSENFSTATAAVVADLTSGPWTAQVTFAKSDGTLFTAHSETSHPSVDLAMMDASGELLGAGNREMPLHYTLTRKSPVLHGKPTIITGTFGAY